jgi:Asp-tRNA(Asn)/Glu-tRNA(Gln) amidotransferase C subunit
MGAQSNVIPFLRALAERQRVEPTDEDLEAVAGFLETIIPLLEELEELLPADATP